MLAGDRVRGAGGVRLMLARGVGVRYNHSCYANGNCGGFLCPDTFIRLAQRAGKHSGVIPALRWRSNQTVMLTGPLAFDKENLKMGKYRVPGAYHPDSELFTLPITAPNQLQDFRFSRAALGIYVALCSCVEDESEIVTISHNTLRKTVGCSLPTIAGVLQRLEKMGRIEVIEWEHSRANLSDRLRWRVFKRDGYKCVYCGKEDGPFEVDHVLPIDKGGRDNMKNLVTACPRCNRKKSNKVVNND